MLFKSVLISVLFSLLTLGVAIKQSCAAEDVQIKENADGSATMTLSAEQWATCQANSGCIIAPRDMLKDMIDRVIKDQVQKACGKDI